MKKIILVGPQDWFVDSFIYFIEKGFNGIVIKLKNTTLVYESNYAILKQVGYDIIEANNLDINNLKLDEQTLVISGPNFGGDIISHAHRKKYSEEVLDITYNISKYNKDNNCGAKVIRWFNGDTAFGTQNSVNLFNEKIEHLDALIFDNSLLEEFVLKNIPNARNIPRYLSWIETPLERFVKNNTNTKIDKKFISLGRVLCSSKMNYRGKYISYGYIPSPGINRKNIDNIILGWQSNSDITIAKLFGIKITLKKKRKYLPLNLAGAIEDVNKIYFDRESFYNNYGTVAFGLSHFYDIFNKSIDNFIRNKDFYFSLDGQSIAYTIKSQKEMYYSFSNVPSKDITYLMYGIIPIISHNLHNVYMELINKKIAIQISNIKDIDTYLNMKEDDILEYRKNIYNNRDVFTFEKSGELLINLLN